MPIIWRHLLTQFSKVLILSLLTCIVILLVYRLEGIARFANLGSSLPDLLLFTYYQIVVMLPIILPISALISSTLLYQHLSNTNELTILRASGMGMRLIASPIIFFGLLLSILNFVIASEFTTSAFVASKQILNTYSKENPLKFIQTAPTLEGRSYIGMEAFQGKDKVKNLHIIFQDPKEKQLCYFGAQSATIKGPLLLGEKANIITAKGAKMLSEFDTLMLENIQSLSMPYQDLLDTYFKTNIELKNDHLPLSILIFRINEIVKKVDFTKLPGQLLAPPTYKKIEGYFSEIARRLCIALATLTFVLMGMAAGVRLRNVKMTKNIILVIISATFILTCFFIAKNFSNNFVLASCLYILPQLLIISLSIWNLKRISRGLQ